MEQNPIVVSIEEKTRARDRALRDAQVLEGQIKMLREALAITQPTDYERYLQGQAAPVQPTVQSAPTDEDVKATAAVIPMAHTDDGHESEELPKTPRGALRSAIRDSLASAADDLNIDQIYDWAHKALGTNTSRDSVRATLAIMKKTGEISNPRYGAYALPKSKTPSVTAEGVSNVNQASLDAGTESAGLS